MEYKTLKEARCAAREEILNNLGGCYRYIFKTKSGRYKIYSYFGNLEHTGMTFIYAIDKSGAKFIWKEYTKNFKMLVKKVK
ncbi:MAG: hypothetical protein ACI4VL_05835 [Bacilli bacterium]